MSTARTRWIATEPFEPVADRAVREGRDASPGPRGPVQAMAGQADASAASAIRRIIVLKIVPCTG